ncbi:MAG: DUF1540 domain-containing protein [Firmicutes bacterium]|nr:DUF1540 domain-containing protein [Bacillota bacterium]
MAINESIKCRVDSCKHFEKNHCSLTDITVGNDCLTNAKDCSDTECRSFETH